MEQTKITQKQYIHNMVSQTDDNVEYTSMEATIVEIMMYKINNQDTVKRSSFMETFSLKLGINKFCQKGYKSTCGEILQIHKIV